MLNLKCWSDITRHEIFWHYSSRSDEVKYLFSFRKRHEKSLDFILAKKLHTGELSMKFESLDNH